MTTMPLQLRHHIPRTMPTDSKEPRSQNAFMHTFDSRERIIEALKKCQEKEHLFCKEAAAVAAKHMRALCSAWIRVLIDQVRDSEPSVDERFLHHTGIQRELLVTWRTAYRDQKNLQGEIVSASTVLAESERLRSTFAGAIWGAKKGNEQPYQAASKARDLASAHLDKLRAELNRTERDLDESSDVLLRACISKSELTSTSREFGIAIAQVLREMQAEHKAMERAHAHAQNDLIETIDHGLNFLKMSYRQP